jgi:SAM-dependent methyltransferase
LFAFVRPDNKVFDIGCGSGQFCLLLNHFKRVSELMGIEISDRLVYNARQLFGSETGAKKHTFEVYDGKNIPD